MLLVLLKFACGAATGAAAASHCRARCGGNVAYGASSSSPSPRASAKGGDEAVGDAAAAAQVPPVRAVIVGGGYAGSKLAFYLDSLFDVTLIDEKNYYEHTPELLPLLFRDFGDGGGGGGGEDNANGGAKKGGADGGKVDAKGDDAFARACRGAVVLHRSYLRHANVLTGTVDGVDDTHVHLRDGRAVPYELLIVATGERKPFPLSTRRARTLAARMRELRAFAAHVRRCRGKVAVLGGGPAAVSLAQELAVARPDLQVHLYFPHDEVLAAMPRVCRAHAARVLRDTANVRLHPRTRVTDVRGYDAGGALCVPPAAADAAAGRGGVAGSSWWFARLLRGKGAASGGGVGAEAATTLAAYSDTSGRVDEAGEEAVAAAMGERAAPVRYDVCYAVSRRRGAAASSSPPSILAQVLLPGRRAQQRQQRQRDDEADGEGDDGEVGVDEGYAHVFSLLGSTPRPVVAGAGRPNLLRAHEHVDGHYRASSLCQLLGLPHVFAIGRCNNLPLTRCCGTSDAQVRMLFRALASIAQGAEVPRVLGPRDALRLSRLSSLPPRFAVRLGPGGAVSSTPWAGGVVGLAAVTDCERETAYLMREFRRPVSFKRPDAAVVRARVEAWRAAAVTDITDFSHC